MKELFEFFAGADIRDQLPPPLLEVLTSNLREMEALVHSEDAFSVPGPDRLKSLEMPVLVLTTSNTMPLLHCTNQMLVEALPEARHHHLEDAGHELWTTHAEALAELLSSFLTGPPAR